MALTDHCSVFVSFAESGINDVFRHLQAQRPSLFNFGTSFFAAQPAKLCAPLIVAPGFPRGQPRLTTLPLLPVPGTDYGLEYCAQISKLVIDFHPGTIQLPSELKPPLGAQKIALSLGFCLGVGCSNLQQLWQIGEQEALKIKPVRVTESFDVADSQAARDQPLAVTQPLPVDSVHCFCVDVFAICGLDIVIDNFGRRLALRLEGLELVDIRPTGLEDVLECLIKSILTVGVLPRLRIPLDRHIFSLGEYGSLTVQPTAISSNVPYNPNISNNQLSLFVDVS